MVRKQVVDVRLVHRPRLSDDVRDRKLRRRALGAMESVHGGEEFDLLALVDQRPGRGGLRRRNHDGAANGGEVVVQRLRLRAVALFAHGELIRMGTGRLGGVEDEVSVILQRR